MAKWFFEPGHTAAAFSVRHRMVTFVRGHFKDSMARLSSIRRARARFPSRPRSKLLESGQVKRRATPTSRARTFSTWRKHPKITFAGKQVELAGANEAVLTGALTIRGITRTVPLRVHYLGQWQTPWWEEGVDKGPKTRAGFAATATINRHDFGVSWNSTLDRGGVVVGNMVDITIDAEAILQEG